MIWLVRRWAITQVRKMARNMRNNPVETRSSFIVVIISVFSLPFHVVHSWHVSSWVDYINVFISVPHSSVSRRSSPINIVHNVLTVLLRELRSKVINGKCSLPVNISFSPVFFSHSNRRCALSTFPWKMHGFSLLWIGTFSLLLTRIDSGVGLYEKAPHIIVFMADDLVWL